MGKSLDGKLFLVALFLAVTSIVGFKCIGTSSKSNAGSDSTLSVLSINVAGLPSALSSGNPSVNTKLISPLLNKYDIVSVQEDFAYHSDLVSSVTLPYLTNHSGNVPVGDGMNFMSAYPLYETTRYKWNDSHGFISDGADQMTPKGILYSSVEVSDGFFIDIYDIHTDAGSDSESYEARCSNMNQLAKLINERSIGKAVIVLGDTNSRYTRAEDNFESAVLDTCGLSDAWVEIKCNGVRPSDGDALSNSNAINSSEYEVVDKIWYRSGRNVELSATSYELLDKEFTDSNGEQLSDHYPVTASFVYSVKDSIKTSETYGGGGGTAFSFIETMQDSMPNKISINSGKRIDNVSFTYGDVVAQVGGTGGTYKELILNDGEYITNMEVCKAKKSTFGTYRISYVKFTTNLGNILEGGTKGSTSYKFSAPDGYSISGVHGFCGGEIDRLGAIYMLLK